MQVLHFKYFGKAGKFQAVSAWIQGTRFINKNVTKKKDLKGKYIGL